MQNECDADDLQLCDEILAIWATFLRLMAAGVDRRMCLCLWTMKAVNTDLKSAFIDCEWKKSIVIIVRSLVYQSINNIEI